MKSLISLSTLLLAAQTLASPVKRQSTNIDATVLQFALTLEHLENVFYKKALADLSEKAFTDAGYPAKYYSDIKYIAHDEESHVTAITAGLKAAGVTPNVACTYEFPFTDVKSFVTLSSVLEGVGTSAYLGAAGLITSKDYLTIAGSILAVEALHTSMQRSARGLVAAANPYYTPLGPNPVFTLAASFIKSCPASNAPLPFKAFPGLTAATAGPLAMEMPATFTLADGGSGSGKFVTFVSGLVVASVPITEGMGSVTVKVPKMVEGQSYVFITSSDVTGGPGNLTDAAITNGPAIVEVTPSSPTFDPSVL